jgi:tetratricopeptide (TPR) repeat protein
MSIEPANTVDPFDISVLDEETELRALVRALQFGDKFALIFVRCNQPQQRKELIEKLRAQLPQFNLQEIHFSEPTTHLLDSLRERISDPRPDAVFVSGLEYSLPTAADAHNTPFIANLNAARNSFPQVAPCPLVLWVPEYVLTAISRGAPDFFSIRSGVYFFATAPGETSDFAHALTAGSGWAVWNLSLSEKQERIAAIESLLTDYEALPSNRRDYQIEMRLCLRLAHLLLMQGAYSSGQRYVEKSLCLARELSNLEWQASALNGLGHIYHRQGRLEEAAAVYLQCLEIHREVGDRDLVAQDLSSLGKIYLKQNHMIRPKNLSREV